MRSLRVLAAAAAVAGCASSVQADNRLEAIDPLTFSFGAAIGVSQNGLWVGGGLGSPQTSFIWSAATAITTALPDTPLGGGYASAVSDSGAIATVVVGSVAHRYTSSGYQVINNSTGDLVGMSPDGTSVVGLGTSNSPAWTWTESGGLVPLPTSFTLGGASGNALRLAGATSIGPAIRNQDGTITQLTPPTGVTGAALAKQVSNDGTIACGNIGNRAWQWASGVPSLIPTIPGNPNASMNVVAMADDGNIIFGNTNSGSVGVWVWTPELGTVTIRQFLIAAGVSVSGWSNFGAFDASADGHTLVGLAGNGGGFGPFYLHLDQFPVPAPSGALLLGLAALLRARRSR